MIAHLLAAAALGFHAGPAVHQHQPGPSPQVMTLGQGSSRNWAGYVAEGDSFNRVSATWVEPRVNCAATGAPASALFWVGFDGWNNGNVEQGGSYAVCGTYSATPSYWLWWEMYPTNGISIVASIRPGDMIHASVRYVAPTYVITETDVTTGQSNEQDVQCEQILGVNQCPRTSAEAIAEDTGTGVPVTGFYPLADYGTVKFTGAWIHDRRGHRGGFINPNW